MRTIRFLGLPKNAPIKLHVAQGGQTASRDMIVNTNADTELPGGPISIVTDRSVLQVAPDSVHFSVDLSGSLFETPRAATPSSYDRRYHELSYRWNFGTWTQAGKSVDPYDNAVDPDTNPDQYTVPEKMLETHRAANIAFGPEVSKMFTKPGTYQVEVEVLEPLTGRVARATTEIVVGDADLAYAATQTYVVAHDNSFTGKPLGAVERNSLSDAVAAAAASKSSRGRILLKRGGTYTISSQIRIDTTLPEHMFFGAWGDGPDPVITSTEATEPTYYFNFTAIPSTDPRRDARFSNITFKGSWDPVNAKGHVDQVCINSLANIFMAVSECTARNMGSFCRIQGLAEGIPNAHRTHFHELAIEEYKNYPIYFGPMQESRVALTGVRTAQNPDAYSNWPAGVNSEAGATVRINASHTYVDGCDFFSHNSHGSNDLGYPQPCLRLNDIPWPANNSKNNIVDGFRLNVQRSALEGGSNSIVLGGGNFNAARSIITNAVFDQLVMLGNFSSRPFIKNYNGGVTIRNCLFVLPAAPYSGTALDQGFVWHLIAPLNGSPDRTAEVAPNRIYSSTFVVLRTSAQNNGFAPGVFVNAVGDPQGRPIAGSTGYLDATEHNNVLYMPKLNTPVIDVAPLDVTGPVLWEPRNKGRRIPSTGQMLEEYGTPTDTLHSFAAIGQSSAVGSAPSDHIPGQEIEWVSPYDIRGVERAPHPNKGAWDVIDGS